MARRVLVSPYFDPTVVGGGTLNTLDLARSWLSQGHEVHILKTERAPTSLGGLTEAERRGRLVLHSVAPVGALHRANAFHPQVEARAGALLREIDPESVHVHNFHGLLGAVRAALDGGWPTVYTALGFGLVCPTGYLYDGTLEPCDGPAPAKCRACLWREDIVEPLRHRAARAVPAPLAWPVARSHLPAVAARLAAAAPDPLTRPVLGPDVNARLREQQSYLAAAGDWLAGGRALLPRLDAVVVATPLMASVLHRYGVPRERLHLLPWGVLANRAGLPLPPRPARASLRLAFLGHVGEVKGLPFLAQVLAALPDDLDLEVTAYGGAAWLLPKLPRRARRYLRSGRFDAGGVVAALREADGTLVPSLWHENAPFAILETLACGRPAIVARRDGMAHLIEEGRNGLVLPAGDVPAWRRCLESLALKPSVLRAMVPACHWERTPAIFASELDDVVRAAIKGRERGIRA